VSALFVTASGTGIGKTLVAAALIHQLRADGRAVRALKPVMTGYDPAAATESDAGRILASLGEAASEPAIQRLSPWRFRAPLSPDMAAAREGARIDFEELVRFCRTAAEQASRDGAAIIVEGIGGVMVPLDERRTVRDWIAALECPALLVVGSYLGSLSHALTAIEALRMRRVPIAGIVVSESVEPAAPLAEVVATLARHAGAVPMAAIPRIGRATDPWREVPDLRRICDQL
jgi:dethiobiotin synthetase